LKYGNSKIIGILSLIWISIFCGFTADRIPQRVICMAPALTEICFALEFGDHIVGVTDFCRYPPEVRSMPKVGGFLNPNLEKIVLLNPDLVFLVPEEKQIGDHLSKLGIQTMTISTYTVEDTKQAMIAMAAALGDKSRGEALSRKLARELEILSEGSGPANKPSVLMVVGRDTGGLSNIYIAGTGTFLNELLIVAGGRNAYQDKILYPDLSLEGISMLNPDIIIEFWSDAGLTDEQRRKLISDWARLSYISAVRTGRIFILDDASLTIPGPRIVESVRKIKKCLVAGKKTI